MPFSKQEIVDFVADQGELKWVKARSLLENEVLACVDGRCEHSIFGTPGGSAGELLVGLAACEQVGRKIDPGMAGELLESWQAHLGAFYMHGDMHAMSALPGWMTNDLEGRAEAEAARELEGRIAGAPEHKRSELLEVLAGSGMGCGHLKLMLESPDVYGVPRELAVAMRGAFFEALWRGEQLVFPILAGAHREGAVCHVTTEKEPGSEDEIPAFTPCRKGRQSFVVHPQAVAFERDELHAAIQDVIGGTLSRDEWKEKAEEIWSRQAGATLTKLALGAPIYEVRFSGRDDFTVLGLGHVEG